jgi:hypothetical protein
MTEDTLAAPVANRFDRMEMAGTFGDLGTLVPFVVAYISVLKMDPFGVLLAFGVAMIACGFVTFVRNTISWTGDTTVVFLAAAARYLRKYNGLDLASLAGDTLFIGPTR